MHIVHHKSTSVRAVFHLVLVPKTSKMPALNGNAEAIFDDVGVMIIYTPRKDSIAHFR